MSNRSVTRGPLTCRLCPNEWLTFTKYSTFRAHLRAHHQITTFDRKDLVLYQTRPGSAAQVEFDPPRQSRSQERFTAQAGNVAQANAAVPVQQLDVQAVENSIATGMLIYIYSCEK